MKIPQISFSRRRFVTGLSALGALGSLGLDSAARGETAPRSGRLRQGLCPGVFSGSKLDLDGQCREAARLGCVGIDLVGPEAFPTLKKYGLIPTMIPGGSGIQYGINNPANHADILTKLTDAIKTAASAGAPNVIVLAGDRAGFTDEQSLDNSVAFLNKIKRQAEDAKITLCVELLNSKVDHRGYVCDSSKWGVALCKRVDSPRVKLLYDIYHMQIMEGDVIRTIRENIQYIAHFHTAGNPGRREFDDSQELNYTGICQALAGLKFSGVISHEYTPTKDPIGTLEKMLKLCDV